MIILLILCFFCPFLRLGGYPFPISYLVIAFVGVKGLSRILRENGSKVTIFIFFCYFIYSVLICLVHGVTTGHLDNRGILGAIMSLLALGASDYLSRKLQQYEPGKVLTLLNFPLLLNNVIVLLLFYSESFKNTLYSIISVNPRVLDYPIPRYSGLSYDGFSYSSTLNALFFLIIVVLLTVLKNKLSGKNKLFCYLNLLLTFLTTILIGRTGVGIIIGGLLIFFLLDFIFSSVYAKTKFVVKFLVSAVALGVFCYFILNYFLVNLPFYDNVIYGFKVYSEFFETGTIQDASVDDITQNHYFLPNGLISNLIGIGNFGRGNVYIPSDIGFVLAIHGFGFLGIALFITCIYFLYYFAVKTIGDLNLIIKIGVVLTILIAVNFKDYYIFYPIGHYILVFTFIFYLKQYIRTEKNEK